MTSVDVVSEKAVTRPRPLRVLVPLIKEDLKRGDEAARSAAMPHYIAAGEKMLEAKPAFKGRMEEFDEWLKRNFDLSKTSAYKYMELVPNETTNRARGGLDPRDFKSMNAFHQATGHPAYVPNKPRPQAWHDPVKNALGKVDLDVMRQAELKRAEERELQRKLALQLIDIGFKALASKLHPDKGGSRDAMTRLYAVRERLKSSA